jgi:hypothetical protein
MMARLEIFDPFDPKWRKPMTGRTALSADELRAELRALTACWEAMQPLDTHARSRLVEWLQTWVHSERKPDGGY